MSKEFLLTKIELFILGLSLGLLLAGIILGQIFLNSYKDRIYPGVQVDGVLVAGLSKAEAENLLKSKAKDINNIEVILSSDEFKVSSSSADLGIHRDYQVGVDAAFDFSRDRNFFYKLYSIWKSQDQKPEFHSQLKFDEEKLTDFVTLLAKQANTPSNEPFAELKTSGSSSSLIINPGLIGQEIQIRETVKKIENANKETNIEIQAEIEVLGREISDEEVQKAREKAQQLVNVFLQLRAKDIQEQISDQQLISVLAFPDGFNGKMLDELVEKLAENTHRETQDGKLEYDKDTLKVSKFTASKTGVELKENESKEQIQNFINKTLSENNIDNARPQFFQEDLKINETQPNTPLSETNELGINELIGFGDSEYEHSIPNRIYNVAHAAELINNVLVPPGQEFSMVKTLGPVSKETGFKSAYVIKDGATVLGDGGGVCQVSTTVFRAALDAGVEITRRLPHSYRVSYYELNSKPGVDATVYTGNVDLRFINNTPGYILINTETNSQKLYMTVKIYGISDGRTTEITNHRTWDYQAPPATEYIPTSELPTGVTKRVENAIPGVKAEFTHIVRNKAGEIISEKNYFSNYKAWGAKYLVGI